MHRTAPACATMIALAVLAAGCGGKQPEVQEPVAAKPSGPNREVFAPLDAVLLQAALPKVIGGDEDVPCFQPVTDLVPADADPVVRETIKDHNTAVTKVVRAWLSEKLATAGVSPSLIDKWSVEPVDPVVLEVPRERVRFTETPTCLSGSGWLPEGRYLATALFGARKFAFKSSIPLAADTQQSMLQTLGMDNVVINSEALFVYEAARAGDGSPMLSPEGKPLFTSPSGEFITEDQVPPPEKRMMSEWEMNTDAPLWFAYRALPSDGWRKEGDKQKCNVILIPEALNPQVPECAEFRDAAFTVSILEGEEKPVSITITSGQDQHKGVMLDWDEGTKVQVNDRIILWLMPKKVEVGVELFINSLVIDPLPLADEGGGGGGADDESYAGVPAAPEKAAPAPEAAKPGKGKGKKAEAEPAKKEEPPAKKKGKATDADALDAYLND